VPCRNFSGGGTRSTPISITRGGVVLSALALSRARYDELLARERRIAQEIEREGITFVTEDNRRKNIADELPRGDEFLRAASALLDLGLHSDSLSRSSYAVLHHLRVVFSAEDARAQLEDARSFVAEARSFLLGEGWLPQ
jgi:hypothetical protein